MLHSTLQTSLHHLPEGYALWATLNAALQAHTNELRIAACGLLKAGKSSLLNALTDQLDTEWFATGATRTTVQNQFLTRHNFTFIDTPGLDATAQDDAEAWAGLHQADILLFVHHPGTGELHREEMEFLARLTGQPGARQTLANRLLVVLSHLDSISQDDMAWIEARVQAQIHRLTGFQPRCFQVSFTAYKKGKLQAKTALANHSGIPALQTCLGDPSLRAICQSFRKDRIRESRQRLLDAVDQALALRQGQIRQLQRNREQLERNFMDDATRLLTHLHSKMAFYNQFYS